MVSNNNNNNRAVIYSRVSTNREEQESSLKNQRTHYADWAKENGYELVGEYYDEGLSATSSNRTHFIRMLEDAGLKAERRGNRVSFEVDYDKEPLFDWIILKDASRFARNVNAVDIVRDLRDKDVYIIFEGLSFTSKDLDWEFRLGLFLTFAQEESLSTSRKLRDIYKQRAQRGKFHMSVNLIGYGRDKDTKEYYIKENQAKIVREIFDYYTEDKIGSYQIADILNSKGYKTKQGRNFNGNSVTRILKNEKFKGQVIQNRYSTTDITGSKKRVINPKDEWIIHDNALPKIVSVEQFDKAQEILKSRTTTTARRIGSNQRQVRGKKVVKNIFYRKIWCGKCKSDYIRETAIKTKNGERVKEYYYGCRNRRNKQRNVKKCMNRGISHDVLIRELERIGKTLNLIDLDNYTIAHESVALEDKLNELDDMINNTKSIKQEIDSDIQLIDDKIANLFDTLATGVSKTIVKITQDKIGQLKDEQTRLEAKKLEYDVISLESQKQKYKIKFEEIVKLSKKDTYTLEEILEQLHAVRVLNDTKVVVEFKVPTLRSQGDRLAHFMFTR